MRLCLRGLTTRNCSYTCSTDATAHATAHATPPTTVVVVGGLVDEGSGVDDVVGCFGVCAPTKFYGRHLDTAWTGVKDLTHAISEQGIIAIMIGLPDGDEQQYAENEQYAKGKNSWPCKDYSRFLSAAVDHLLDQAPKHGIAVDTARIGLVGFSMGGGGVLFAAGNSCKDKVAAVAAVNPGLHSVHSFYDNKEGCQRYAKGAPHSGDVREMKWHARNETAWPGSGGEAKSRGENADCAGGNIFTCEARGSRSGAEPATAASTSSHGL